ncbi:MAG: hypothetical protein ACSLFO_02000 [Acidimicrobiales bacterium]
MNDDTTPDLELASAYLDGEATDTEVARVESDIALLDQVRQLEALRSRLGTPPPPAGLVDDHVGTALAAFDGSTADVADPPGEPAPPVADLAARRTRRWYERVPLGAVAAAVAVVALVGAISQIDLGDDDDMAADSTSAALESSDDSGDSGDESGGGTDSATVEDSAESEAPMADAQGGGDDGEESDVVAAARLVFSDVDALADHVDARANALAQTGDPSTTTSAEEPSGDAASGPLAEATNDRCGLEPIEDLDPDTVVLVVPAVLAGRDVTAIVVESEDRRLVVVDDVSCEIAEDRLL